MMKLGAHLCLAIFLGGLLAWTVSYCFEPRLHFIVGNLQSFEMTKFGLLPSADVSWARTLEANEKDHVDDQFVNVSAGLLMEDYDLSVNASTAMPAVVEDPTSRKVGVAFIVDTQEGRKLVVVLPDGWIREYTIPTEG